MTLIITALLLHLLGISWWWNLLVLPVWAFRSLLLWQNSRVAHDVRDELRKAEQRLRQEFAAEAATVHPSNN